MWNLKKKTDESNFKGDSIVSRKTDEPEDTPQNRKNNRKSSLPADSQPTIVEHDVPASQGTYSEDATLLAPMKLWRKTEAEIQTIYTWTKRAKIF